MTNDQDGMKEITDLYLTILAWTFLPSIATWIIQKFLHITGLLNRPKCSPATNRQRQFIQTALIIIYALYELHTAYQSFPRSHYAVLNCRPDDLSKMKSTYRRLSLMYHPDKNDAPSAERTFRQVRTAYDFLSDPMKRRVYNLMGHLPQTATNTCKIYKDYLGVYAVEQMPYYISLLVAMMISFGMSRKSVSFARKMAMIIGCIALDVGLVTGSLHLPSWFLGPVPVFVALGMLRKSVMVFCMLQSQLMGIWANSDQAKMSDGDFVKAVKAVVEEEQRWLDYYSSLWFNFGKTQEDMQAMRSRAAQVIVDIQAEKKNR
jgi:hypothetical protein